MQDIANEVVRQLRAEDGDLDVWVRWHWCLTNYKIQPTVRDGKLRWLWCGHEHTSKFTLLLEDVDDLLELLFTQFLELKDMQNGNRSTGHVTCLILGPAEKGGENMLLRYSVDAHGAGDRLKRFLLRCPHFEICKEKQVSISKRDASFLRSLPSASSP